MSLQEYLDKRDFSKTPEPQQDEKPKKGTLRFVVQKHQASKLHYDFRLEMGSVLKSWAVPKEPSMSPADKRLAIMVEDHPLAYRTFEGEIPEGSYGAGTVEIWDQGTYTPQHKKRGEDSEQLLLKELEEGSIKIILKGKKLKGTFSLIKMQSDDPDSWLLIKQKEEDISKAAAAQKKTASKSKASTKKLPATTDKGVTVEIEGHSLTLTNLDKIYWPDEGYTKSDLIHYYRRVAKFILPYLQDRPQSLHRHPNGIQDAGFYQREIQTQLPDWVEQAEIYSESTKRNLAHVLCQNEATLVYLNNLGCIEIHPWNARIQSLDRPDYLALDLDPGENTFDEVIEVAQAVKKVLDKAEATCYCKTSGATGMHIYVPLGRQYTFDEAEAFARRVAEIVHAQLPELTSLERSPKDRRKQIYLDYLQNNKGQSLAAAYSVRPKPGATVSTPLKWTEVKKGLKPAKFTIHTVPIRLDLLGDLFGGVLSAGVDLDACMERLKVYK